MAERPMAPDCKSGGLRPTQVRILLCPFHTKDRKDKKDFYTAGVAQLAEHQLSKLNVTGSIPVTRFAT